MLHLEGQKFGKLLVIERRDNYKWLCLCEECNTYIEVYGWNLTSGSATSCGCKRGFKPRFTINIDIKDGITFYDIATNWIYSKKAPFLAKTSIANYEDRLNLFNCLWEIPIKAFNKENCIPIIAYFAQEKYSYSYFLNNYRFLYNIFEFAIENKIITNNPLEGIPKPRKKIKNDTHTIWTYNQYLEFSDTFDLDNPKDVTSYTIFSLMFYTGLRKEEAVALSPSRVDLDKKTIVIDQAWEYKVKCMGVPKSPNSYRTIKICNELHKILEYYFNFFKINKESNCLLFSRNKDRSEPVSASFLRYNMNKHQELATLPYLKVHELRHSFVVMVLKNQPCNTGMLYAIAHHIGDTPATTMNWYMHTTNTEDDIAEYIDEIHCNNKMDDI